MYTYIFCFCFPCLGGIFKEGEEIPFVFPDFKLFKYFYRAVTKSFRFQGADITRVFSIKSLYFLLKVTICSTQMLPTMGSLALCY